jgi:hypothetical protein
VLGLRAALHSRPKGLATTVSRIGFDWKRVVRKEYGTTLSWTTTVKNTRRLDSPDRDWRGAFR